MTAARFAVAMVVLAAAPIGAAAQPRYEESFDAWDSDCIAIGTCGDTLLDLNADVSADVSTDCPDPGRSA